MTDQVHPPYASVSRGGGMCHIKKSGDGGYLLDYPGGWHGVTLDDVKILTNELWELGFNIQPFPLSPAAACWQYCPHCGEELR